MLERSMRQSFPSIDVLPQCCIMTPQQWTQNLSPCTRTYHPHNFTPAFSVPSRTWQTSTAAANEARIHLEYSFPTSSGLWPFMWFNAWIDRGKCFPVYIAAPKERSGTPLAHWPKQNDSPDFDPWNPVCCWEFLAVDDDDSLRLLVPLNNITAIRNVLICKSR